MEHIPPAGSFEYLKTLAISRLFLDNFDNFQSSWVTQGPKIGQLSLKFGANDMGGTNDRRKRCQQSWDSLLHAD